MFVLTGDNDDGKIFVSSIPKGETFEQMAAWHTRQYFQKMEEDRERGQIKNKMYNLCKHSRSQENGFSESGMASACDLRLLLPIAPPEPPAKENLKLIKPAKKKRITWKT